MRILSATHKDLAELVAEGSFREDLFYRINVIGLQRAAAARTRRGRTAARAPHAQPARRQSGGSHARSSRVPRKPRSSSYRFPGNVRELENILERALTLCAGDEIDVDDLQLPSDTQATAVLHDVATDAPLGTHLEEIERDAIVKALEQTRYNKTAAAKRLGITFRALRYRIKKLGIE